MQLKEPLLYAEDVYELASRPSFQSPTMRDAGFRSIDSFVEETFNKIPYDAIEKYERPKNGNKANSSPTGITRDEQEKLTRFYACLMHIGHEGMWRASGEPYGVHPSRSAFFEANYGVSSFSLDSTLIHDLGEEWMKVLGADKKQKDYSYIKTAVLLAPAIMAYEYARSEFSSPERFFPHISMIQMVYNSLTRWPDESYFKNLHDAFYTQEKNIPLGKEGKKINLQHPKKRKKIVEYLNSLFQINNEKLVKDFHKDVILGYNAGEEGWKKIRRRAIMGKVADGRDNSSDLLNQETTKAIKILSKDIFTINQIMIMKSLMKKTESVEELNRVMHETEDFKKVLFSETGVTSHLVRQLERTGEIPESYMEKINKELDEYVKSPFIAIRTSPEEDNSSFSNILNTCISALLGDENNIVDKNDTPNQWKYLRVFQEVGKKFLEKEKKGDNFIIRKFDLRQLYKEEARREGREM